MSPHGSRTGRAHRRAFLGAAAGAFGIAAAPIREEAEEVLPLKYAYATIEQVGLLALPGGVIPSGKRFGGQSLLNSKDLGPSNLFLVAGDKIADAVAATWYAFFHGFPVDRPVTEPGKDYRPENCVWAVFFLGAAQSEPQQWTLTRATVQGERVRMSVVLPVRLSRVFNYRVYMFWVPLGPRKGKAITLDAYDDTNRASMMVRRVLL